MHTAEEEGQPTLHPCLPQRALRCPQAQYILTALPSLQPLLSCHCIYSPPPPPNHFLGLFFCCCWEWKVSKIRPWQCAEGLQEFETTWCHHNLIWIDKSENSCFWQIIFSASHKKLITSLSNIILHVIMSGITCSWDVFCCFCLFLKTGNSSRTTNRCWILTIPCIISVFSTFSTFTVTPFKCSSKNKNGRGLAFLQETFMMLSVSEI